MSNQPEPSYLSKPSQGGNPIKTLQAILKQRPSGRATFTDPDDPSVAWRIYFGGDQIHFASSTVGQRERFSYLIQRLAPHLKIDWVESFDSDYQALCELWKTGQLSLPQVRKLMTQTTQEALVHFMTAVGKSIQFDATVGLDPILLSLTAEQVLAPITAVIPRWVEARSLVGSPLSRPYIVNQTQFSQLLWLGAERFQMMQAIGDTLQQNLCLYEVAQRLQTDVLELATLLQSLVRGGAVSTRPFQAEEQQDYPVIACLTQAQTVQQCMLTVAENLKLQPLILGDSPQAITILMRQKPNLILIDLALQDVDGLDLCRTLHQTNLLKDIPIIVLTTEDNLMDRLRIRLSGATAHLSKPLRPQDLRALVEKLLSPSRSN
jgi:twitching motility two-component system response regulator PilG